MRIIYLNIEHGEEGEVLGGYLLSELVNADIFCFEEIDKEIFDNFQSRMKMFTGYWFEKDIPGVYTYSLATFIRKEFTVKKSTTILDDDKKVGAAIGFRVQTFHSDIEVVVVHGKSQPADKLDNPGRIKQSRKILDFLAKVKAPGIVGGDFNLMPTTKSIKMFEDAGYRNLIKDFKIKTTRSKNAWRKALENSRKRGFPYLGKQLFADYVFVTPEIKIDSFEVPQMEVSDHLPMVLEFDVK
jgi:endonuclease/exonuclease/phosphatase (EEP) superfamily protein YafD